MYFLSLHFQPSHLSTCQYEGHHWIHSDAQNVWAVCNNMHKLTTTELLTTVNYFIMKKKLNYKQNKNIIIHKIQNKIRNKKDNYDHGLFWKLRHMGLKLDGQQVS